MIDHCLMICLFIPACSCHTIHCLEFISKSDAGSNSAYDGRCNVTVVLANIVFRKCLGKTRSLSSTLLLTQIQ